MSLRTRLLILIIAAMLVPAGLFALRFMQNRDSEIDAALASLAATADDIAGDLDGKIQGTAQLHYGLARARDLDTRDKAACSAFLSEVREEYPQFTGILTINPDGSLFCDSLRTDRTLDLRDRAYFKQVQDLRGGVAIEPVFGRLTGLSVLQIAYPVRSEAGALKFVQSAEEAMGRLRLSDEPHVQLSQCADRALLAAVPFAERARAIVDEFVPGHRQFDDVLNCQRRHDVEERQRIEMAS